MPIPSWLVQLGIPTGHPRRQKTELVRSFFKKKCLCSNYTMARKYGKKGARKTTRSRKTSGKPSTAVKKYIKSAIHRQIENKRFTLESSATLFAPSNVVNFQASNIVQLTPSSATNSDYTIPQSLGQGGRTGNVITLRKAMFRYVMYPQIYNVTSNPNPKPLDVNIWIFSIKRGVASLTVADAWNVFNGTIFANGNTSNGTVNNLFDLVSVPNKEVIQSHYRRTVKLSPASYYVPGATTANYDNNDYKYNCMGRINITKYLPKRIVFNDTDNSSTSKQVFLVCTPYHADGTTTASTEAGASWFYGIDLEYEDA